MVSTPYNIQLKPNRYIDHYISYASKQLAPSEYWTASNQNIFILQMIFLPPSIFDLHTVDFQICETKNVFMVRHSNVFGIIFLPTSQKISTVEIESLRLHFHFNYSIIWELHIQLVCCKIKFL